MCDCKQCDLGVKSGLIPDHVKMFGEYSMQISSEQFPFSGRVKKVDGKIGLGRVKVLDMRNNRH